MSVYILGIDPGLRTTGIALVDISGRVPRLLAAASLRTPTGTPDHEARKTLTAGLLQCVSRWSQLRLAPITVVGIESYGWQGKERSTNQNAFRLSTLVGQFEGALGYEVRTLTKRECNAAIGRPSTCSKADVKRGLHLVFQAVVGKNEHERDAILVAYAVGKRWLVEQARRRS